MQYLFFVSSYLRGGILTGRFSYLLKEKEGLYETILCSFPHLQKNEVT